MTLIEQLRTRLWERGQVLLQELWVDTIDHLTSLLIDPSQRTYWIGLLTSVAVAVVIGWRRGGTRVRASQFWSRSAWVDYGLIVVRPLLASVFAVPWVLSALGVAMFVVRGLRAWLGAATATATSEPSAGVLVLYTLALFIAWDLSRFALHWLMHRSDVLWQFHQVHHSATELNPFTLFRVHPLESALYQLRGIVVTGAVMGLFTYAFGARTVELKLLGVNAVGFMLSVFSGNLRHSHVWWSFGPRLERWLISPAQHQMHHATDARWSRQNYGTWLALWDRLAGTLRVAKHPPSAFGLADKDRNHSPHSMLSALIDPCLAGLHALVHRPRRLAAGLALLVGLGASRQAHASQPPAEDSAPEAESEDEVSQDEGPQDEGPQDEGPSEVAREPEAPAQETKPSTSTTSQAATAPAGEPKSEDEDVDVDLSDFDPDEDEGEGVDVDLSDFDPDEDTDDGDGQTRAEAFVDDDPDVDAATPTVSIIGEPEELPRVVGSAHKVDAKTLEREEHDDIHRVLRSIPGVYVRGEDGFGLRPNIGLRGADPNRSSKVTLMEDGVLFGPAPYAAPAAYYFPMITRLTGVEVFKGPAAVRFGPNTIGGAINLQTRDIPRELQTGIDVGAGLWGYGKLHGYAGKSWKRFGFLAEGVRVRSSGFKELDGGGDTGFRKNEFMIKARLHGDPGARVYQQFDVKLGLSTELSNETYLGLTDEDFKADPFRRYRASALDQMDWWRSQSQASYFVARGIVEFQSTLYRHDFSRAWTKFNRFNGGLAPDPYTLFQNPEEGSNGIYLALLRGEADSAGSDENLLIGTNDRSFVSQGWQNTLRISPQTRVVDQVIEVGARLHYDEVRRTQDEDQYAMQNGSLVLQPGSRVIHTRNRGEALVGSFHVVDELHIAERFTLSPGARVEVIHTEFLDRGPVGPDIPEMPEVRASSDDVVFLPGMGMHVQATKWLGVLAGVHSGFSPKAPGQAQSVEAERSINYEAGVRMQHKGVHGEAIGFANDYSNLISNCTVSQGCDDAAVGTQFSGGEVLIAGAEALLGYRHDVGKRAWIDSAATYTYTWSRFGTTFLSASPLLGEVEEGDALPYVPLHVASLQLAGGMKRWGVHAQIQYNGQMRDVAGVGRIPANERIDRFLTLDMGGNVFVTKRAQIYLNMGNMTRQGYMVSRRPFGARPGARFSLIGGFKYNFG